MGKSWGINMKIVVWMHSLGSTNNVRINGLVVHNE